FAAFFYNVRNGSGESYMLYALAGAPRSAFDQYPMPRNTAVFAPTFAGEGVVRSDDITSDPRYGRNLPHHGMPEGHLPVRSYLAAPVVSRSGEVMGGLFFGHADPGRFSPTHEKVVSGIASQGAAAIDAIRANDNAIAELEARRLTEASLGESLSFALDAGRMGSWKLDVASQAYEASDLCKANYGRRPNEVFGFGDLLGAVHPDDRLRMRAAIDTAIRDGSPYDIEYRVCIPSGEVRWVHVRGRADAIVEGGGAKRMAGVSLDVTERRRAEERQRLLLNELNHRVKNTLAAVQSIAFQTLRSARTPTDFRDAFESRLMALSQTHNLLTEENWEGADLRAVLQVELDAFGGDGRASVTGPDIHLSPKAAVAIGMGFHELATNASKYGALSTAGGGLSVRWRVDGPDLLLEWREEGGPAVEPPSRRGFGSRLLEQGLSAELGGTVKLNYA
ncbi:MAG: HWE histidine kinase domain-containing protein, partial [Pseudomonadota bacterium]